MKQEPIVIIVDFDGTVVTHAYPKIGFDIGAVSVLKELVEYGNKLVLFTMRSGETLTHAIKWFADIGIPLYGIQTNPTQKSWTSSPKAYGQLIIDDAALGCPLMMNEKLSLRPFVNWDEVRTQLIYKGLINWKKIEVKDIDFSKIKVITYSPDKKTDENV